jgi:hypothetical protein
VGDEAALTSDEAPGSVVDFRADTGGGAMPEGSRVVYLFLRRIVSSNLVEPIRLYTHVSASTMMYLLCGTKHIVRVCWAFERPVRLHRICEISPGPVEPIGTRFPESTKLTTTGDSLSSVTIVVTW